MCGSGGGGGGKASERQRRFGYERKEETSTSFSNLGNKVVAYYSIWRPGLGLHQPHVSVTLSLFTRLGTGSMLVMPSTSLHLVLIKNDKAG